MNILQYLNVIKFNSFFKLALTFPLPPVYWKQWSSGFPIGNFFSQVLCSLSQVSAISILLHFICKRIESPFVYEGFKTNALTPQNLPSWISKPIHSILSHQMSNNLRYDYLSIIPFLLTRQSLATILHFANFKEKNFLPGPGFKLESPALSTELPRQTPGPSQNVSSYFNHLVPPYRC